MQILQPNLEHVPPWSIQKHPKLSKLVHDATLINPNPAFSQMDRLPLEMRASRAAQCSCRHFGSNFSRVWESAVIRVSQRQPCDLCYYLFIFNYFWGDESNSSQFGSSGFMHFHPLVVSVVSPFDLQRNNWVGVLRNTCACLLSSCTFVVHYLDRPQHS